MKWKSYTLVVMVVNISPVSSVTKRTLSVQKVWGSVPGLVKSAQGCQQLATVVTFLRSCVAQVPSRGDGPRHLLHVST